jgi:hypothetical protein
VAALEFPRHLPGCARTPSSPLPRLAQR